MIIAAIYSGAYVVSNGLGGNRILTLSPRILRFRERRLRIFRLKRQLLHRAMSVPRSLGKKCNLERRIWNALLERRICDWNTEYTLIRTAMILSESERGYEDIIRYLFRSPRTDLSEFCNQGLLLYFGARVSVRIWSRLGAFPVSDHKNSHNVTNVQQLGTANIFWDSDIRFWSRFGAFPVSTIGLVTNEPTLWYITAFQAPFSFQQSVFVTAAVDRSWVLSLQRRSLHLSPKKK